MTNTAATQGPGLAAITFDSRGGGVAVVARLLRRVLQDRWQERCRVFTLVDGPEPPASLDSSTLMRLRFGSRLAGAQVVHACSWIFYSHLSLGRVQAFVPAPWRRPYAVFLHGVEVWKPLTQAQRHVLKGASLRVANSRVTARRVSELHPDVGPILDCPLALLPDGEPKRLSDTRWPQRIGPRAVILVARMMASERYKGHDQLLDAWPAVIRRVPDARLVFVGAGDDVERLQGRAISLGLASSVIFTGFLADPELCELYDQAAVFAMPSRGEGFGLVYLEAMSRRLPCVGSIHDAAVEVIEDGVTGFLVDQADGPALADRLVLLLTNEGRRREMGEAGLRRLGEHFTYEQFSRRMLDLLDQTFEPVTTPALAPRTARHW